MTYYLYPDDWSKIAYAVKEACGWQCQVCGRQCRRPGEFNLGWEYTLTVAHWHHDYHSPTAFVVACCIRCHFRHDAKHSWQARRRAERYRQRMCGQLVFAFH